MYERYIRFVTKIYLKVISSPNSFIGQTGKVMMNEKFVLLVPVSGRISSATAKFAEVFVTTPVY